MAGLAEVLCTCHAEQELTCVQWCYRVYSVKGHAYTSVMALSRRMSKMRVS